MTELHQLAGVVPLFEFQTKTGSAAVPVDDVRSIAAGDAESYINTSDRHFVSTETTAELVSRFNKLVWNFTRRA